uniref:DNRLRE domain-containing protein n=1 Tax=candidate division WOR-3 bacterium TaxID=2052148 RepID=A0A7C4GBZ3_UNCW3
MNRLILLLALAACACDRLPIGFDQLERVPAAASTTLFPDSLDSYVKYVPLGSAADMLLGRDEWFESRALFRFNLSDSALDSVLSVQLVLFPRDSTPMGFVCRPCSTAWSGAAANWRMADSSTQWLEPGGDYWQLTLCQDTFRGDSLVLELNRSYLDTLVRHSWGVFLFPLDTGFVRVASSSDSRRLPRLILTYHGGIKRTYNSIDDTHIMDTLRLRANPGDLLVGSGVACRTWLRFNIDSIPTEATIARAELRFRPRVLYRRSDTLPVGARRLTESYAVKGRNAAMHNASSGYMLYTPGDSSPEVRIDVHSLIQDWKTRPDSVMNHGLVVVAEPEYTHLFRLRLPRTGSDAPRLEIDYVLPPKDRLAR